MLKADAFNVHIAIIAIIYRFVQFVLLVLFDWLPVATFVLYILFYSINIDYCLHTVDDVPYKFVDRYSL